MGDQGSQDLQLLSAASPLAPAPALERRGRSWLVWSFLLCPCHLPLSLGVLAALLGGTSLGAALRDHTWVAAVAITTTWVVGTAYGFILIRRSQKSGGACPTSARLTRSDHAAPTRPPAS